MTAAVSKGNGDGENTVVDTGVDGSAGAKRERSWRRCASEHGGESGNGAGSVESAGVGSSHDVSW